MFFVIPSQTIHNKNKGVGSILISICGVVLFFLFSLLTTYAVDTAAPPSIITYQGKLLANGSAATSTQSMAFLLYDASSAGNLLYTASGTLVATATVSVTPSSGIFSVNLGDGSLTNAVSSSIFANNSGLYLEVWIGGTKMTPRKRLTSAAYAMNSEYLLGISAAASGTSQYIPYSDSNGNFAFRGTPQSATVGGGVLYINPATANANDTLFGIALGGAERFRVDEDGDTIIAGGLTVDTNTLYVSSTSNRVGVNTTSPDATLHVVGDVVISGTTTIDDAVSVNGKTPVRVGQYVSDAHLGGAFNVFVRGDKAYVVAATTDNLTILNVVDPSNPTLSATYSDTDAGFQLDSPVDVFVSGNYAYVALAGATSSLAIYDVADDNNVRLVATLDDTVGRIMGNPKSIFVNGNYVYFSSFDDDGIAIIDVSDPSNPVYVGGISDGAVLNGAQDVFVSGKYAYVAARISNTMAVVDVSDPMNPAVVGSIADGDGGAELSGATQLFVRNNYAYVTASGGDALTIIDVSKPTTPTYADLYTFVSPESVVVVGNKAYVTSNGTEGLAIIDVSNPTAVATDYIIPVQFGAAPGGQLLGSRGLYISGNYLYVASESRDKVEIFDISGATISSAKIGNIQTDSLEVSGQTSFSNSVFIRGGLNVGNAGAIINGDLSLTSATTSLFATNTIRLSHTGHFITNVASNEGNAYIFDTKNSINNGAANYLFSVRNAGTPVFSIATNGDVQTTGTFYGAAAAVSTPGSPGDLAERVDILPGETVSPGDVMIVDVLGIDRYRKSTGAFSSKVAGVISTKPTITLGDGRTDHTAVMALVGRVPVNVTNENGAIQRGDLLVTASTTGHAMKYDPYIDENSHTVSIIGVALDSFDGEAGQIYALVRSGWINNRYETIAELQQRMTDLASNLGENLTENPEELAVGVNDAGELLNISQDLNLNGNYIVNVTGISGVNSDWVIDADGRFVTNVETREGDKSLYALQSAQTEYVFSGSSQLNDGEQFVDFDDVTKDIIDPDANMKVTVTLTGNANGVYVSEKTPDGFMVKELLGGKSSATFDWVVIATRRLGPLDVVEEDLPEDAEVPAEDTSSTEAIVDEDDPSIEEPNAEVIDTTSTEAIPEENSTDTEEPAPAEDPTPDEEVVLEAAPEEQPIEEPTIEEAPANQEEPPVVEEVVPSAATSTP